MATYNTLAEFAVLLVVAVAIMVAANLLMPRWPAGFRRLAIIAVAVHLLGSVARMSVMLAWYGRGDFTRYFQVGWQMASSIRGGDFTLFLEHEQIWGTQFIERLSGLILVGVGPHMRAEFAVFAVFPTIGLILMAITVQRAFRGIDGRGITMLLLFWPSLIFWPSSIGKEAVILLAVGLVVYGWWGDGVRVRWLPLVGGLALAMLIRPHIGMMIGVALGLADWLAPAQRLTASRIGRGLVLLLVGVFVVGSALSQLGVEADDEAVLEFVSFRSSQTAQGGSKISSVSGPAAIPMAFVNVLMRPFPWEATNPLSAVAAVEIVLFWTLLWRRRRGFWAMLLAWRQSRLLLFIVPLTVVLIVFYGAFVSNLGILTRQRVVVLPFLFVFVEVASLFGRRAASARSRR